MRTLKCRKIWACPKFCVSIIHSGFYSEEVEQKIIKKQKRSRLVFLGIFKKRKNNYLL
ncbi:hypothetical protein [Spiroplasma endosymbiont of Agriotes lineatus]|uniref:hypothetical protein n=1 Tax=Spiroplasma endosymbiont of Agriotes lineatus TaxID=3077930 RepID=UPI0030D57E46